MTNKKRWAGSLMMVGLLLAGRTRAVEDLLRQEGQITRLAGSNNESFEVFYPSILSQFGMELIERGIDAHLERVKVYKALFLEAAMLQVSTVDSSLSGAFFLRDIERAHASFGQAYNLLSLQSAAPNAISKLNDVRHAKFENAIKLTLSRINALKQTPNLRGLGQTMQAIGATIALTEAAQEILIKTALDRDLMLDELLRMQRMLTISGQKVDAAMIQGLQEAVSEMQENPRMLRLVLEEVVQYGPEFVTSNVEVGSKLLSQKVAITLGAKAGASVSLWGLPATLAIEEYATIKELMDHQQKALLSGAVFMKMRATPRDEDKATALVFQRLCLTYLNRSMDGWLVKIASRLWKDIAEVRQRYDGLENTASTLHEAALGFSPRVRLKADLRIPDPKQELNGLFKTSIREGSLVYEQDIDDPLCVSNLVVLVHGWNPNSFSNPYQHGGWVACLDTWAQTKNTYSGWHLAMYDWNEDAATGPIDLHAAKHGSDAAAAAYLQGCFLGETLHQTFKRLAKVQLIAHSAGVWAARSAALLLMEQGKEVQLTFLDPYMPITLPLSQALNKQKMEALDQVIASPSGKGRLAYIESYTASDIAVGTQPRFAWTDAHAVQASVTYNDVQNMISHVSRQQAAALNGALYLYRVVKGHGLPITWYASTMQQPECMTEGWARSMPYREARQAVPAGLAVVAVVDESGSMSGRKAELAKQGVCLFKEMLFGDAPQSEMGLVGFSDGARRLCPVVNSVQQEKLDAGVASFRTNGQTAIGAGIHEAVRCVSESRNRNRVLVLLSDGQHNSGELWPSVEEAAKAGIPIHVVNLEAGPDAATILKKISQQTGGDYFNADVDNIQQIYASIGAQMGDKCILMYKTDIIHQDESRDYELRLGDVVKSMVNTPLIVHVAWPGSRLGFQVRDSAGNDLTRQILSNMETSDTFLSATLSGLREPLYKLRVIGEQVADSGEPFTLQVMGKLPDGLFVKPVRSSYRIGEPVRLAGRAKRLAESGMIDFEVVTPSGDKSVHPVSCQPGPDGFTTWHVELQAPDNIGFYSVVGRVSGEPVFSGSYRCGSVEENVQRRLSTLAMIDRERLQLRQGSRAGSQADAVRGYAALTYAADVVKVVNAMTPVWTGMQQGRDSVRMHQSVLGLLLPFVDAYGLVSVSLEQQGRVLCSTRAQLMGREAPLAGDGRFVARGEKYWARIPVSVNSADMTILLEIGSLSDSELTAPLAAYQAPGDLDPYQSLETRVQADVARAVVDLVSNIEKAVWQHDVPRTGANPSYRAFMRIFPGCLTALTVYDSQHSVVFDGPGARERESDGGDGFQQEISVPVFSGLRRTGMVAAQVVRTAACR